MSRIYIVTRCPCKPLRDGGWICRVQYPTHPNRHTHCTVTPAYNAPLSIPAWKQKLYLTGRKNCFLFCPPEEKDHFHFFLSFFFFSKYSVWRWRSYTHCTCKGLRPYDEMLLYYLSSKIWRKRKKFGRRKIYSKYTKRCFFSHSVSLLLLLY